MGDIVHGSMRFQPSPCGDFWEVCELFQLIKLLLCSPFRLLN